MCIRDRLYILLDHAFTRSTLANETMWDRSTGRVTQYVVHDAAWQHEASEDGRIG